MGDFINQNMGCKHDFHFFGYDDPTCGSQGAIQIGREANWRSSVQSFWPACNTLPPETKYRLMHNKNIYIHLL